MDNKIKTSYTETFIYLMNDTANDLMESINALNKSLSIIADAVAQGMPGGSNVNATLQTNVTSICDEINKEISYINIDSPYGHDAFLTKNEELEKIISSFLN